MKQGMKQTEIGWIPEDWEVTSVHDIAVIRTGGKNTQDRRADGAYPFFVRSQSVEKIDSYSYDGEAVLTAGDGVGVGKVIHYTSGKFDFHQRVYRIAEFAPKVNGLFFFKYFQENFLSRIMQMTAKSSVDSVRMEMIADMNIPLPPLPEQQAIAEALSDADAWIESLEALLQKKRLIKQGAMQELLRPKEGWEVKRLGEVAGLKARIGWQGLTTSEYLDTGEALLVTGTEFSKGSICWDQCHYVQFKRFQQDPHIQLRPKDILVTKDGTIGKVAYVESLPMPTTLNSGIFVIRPLDKSFDERFMSYILLSDVFRDFLSRLAAGSTISHLYQKDFVHFEFSLPPVVEQRRIASLLASVDIELDALTRQLAKARQIKQGMMQQLLTGQIRLVPALAQ